jgi:Tfp pilus assembly protein PilF
MLKPFVLLAAGLAAIGCGGYRVTRVYDGRVKSERFISEDAYAAFARAAELEARGDVAGALAAYREVVGEDPASVEAWVRIGAVECRSGRPDEARHSFEKAERYDPDYSGIWRARAECADRQGRLDERATSRALELDPQNDEVALLHARTLMRLGKLEAARILLHELAVRAPGSRAVWQAIADHAGAGGDGAWREYAQRRLAELRLPASPLASDEAGRQPASPGEGIRSVLDALARGDVALAKSFAHRMRLAPLVVAALALTVGATTVAVRESERRLGADPADSDARLLFALAADVSGASEQASGALAAAMSAPSDIGRLALAELLMRHLGRDAASMWLGAAATATGDVPREVSERLRARIDR